jgi:hypothetical protein
MQKSSDIASGYYSFEALAFAGVFQTFHKLINAHYKIWQFQKQKSTT